MNVTAGIRAPFKPTSLPLPVPKTKPLLHIKKKVRGLSPPTSSSMIFQCHGLWITPSFGRRKKRERGFCKMLVGAPRHGKMTSASTVGRSRCNQPSLRSHIDCFTTAGWTLDVCHFRACKESVTLAELMPHSAGAARIQGAGPYQGCTSERGQAKLFKKDFLYFILFSACRWISRSKCLAPSSAPCFVTPSHFKGLSAHWKQSSGQKYKSNQHNWMHIVGRIRQQPGEPAVFSATTALTITLQTSEAWVEAPATTLGWSNL